MTRGRPFEPGNTIGRGRPKGSKNKSNSVVQRYLNEHAEKLIQKNIAASLRGETKATLWCLDKLMQGTRPGPKLKLPQIKTLDDIAKAYGVILNAVANQKYSVPHAQALFAMIGEISKTIPMPKISPGLNSWRLR